MIFIPTKISKFYFSNFFIPTKITSKTLRLMKINKIYKKYWAVTLNGDFMRS